MGKIHYDSFENVLRGYDDELGNLIIPYKLHVHNVNAMPTSSSMYNNVRCYKHAIYSFYACVASPAKLEETPVCSFFS